MSALGEVRCGRLADLAGFASEASARLQQRRADVTLRPPIDADCIALAASLRADDRTEIAAADRSPLDALRSTLSESTHAVTAVDGEGRVICMFGVGPADLISDAGCPWLFGSDLVNRHWRLFARLSRRYLASMLDLYPHLVAVDARPTTTVRWLTWLGFDLGGPMLSAKDGTMFRAFELRRVASLTTRTPGE